MQIKGMIRSNVYYDSVSLMQISRAVEEHPGVRSAMVGMGTDMNKELLQTAGLLFDEARAAKPSDLIIAFVADEGTSEEEVLALVERKLNEKAKDEKKEEAPPSSLGSAIKRYPEINISLISLPGTYAAQEARKALNRGLHVMLFSDNISVGEEISLKKLAHEKGLLMMGPDCGTAIINGKGLCFANKVRAGGVGIAGASGTGTQEVSVLIDQMGGGVSQVLGTGGRDLSLEVGGIMMLDCIDALDKDPSTMAIVLISKPPVESVAARILERAGSCSKDVVVCFINSPERADEGRLHFASTLEDAARKAVVITEGAAQPLTDEWNIEGLRGLSEKLLANGQKYVRGLYCGGTLCDEAATIFGKALPDEVYSNVGKVRQLPDAAHSIAHSFVDLGDDKFTVGRPHPMIDPDLRNKRIVTEALDPETAVVLFDVELGFGSHRNPAGEAARAIEKAKSALKESGREVLFIAYVLGTKDDLQGYEKQVHLLREQGAIVASSNARAARLSLELTGGAR